MELEEALLGTAPTIAAHEGAPPAVAEPDRASDLGRDVPRARGRAPAPARAVRGGELLLGKFLQERRQCPIKDLRRIPVRDLVAQEGLRESEPLVRFGARCELYLVALGRQRGDDRRTRAGRRDGRRPQIWGCDAFPITRRLRAGRGPLQRRGRGRGMAHSRQPADGGRDRRLGAQPRDELLDLPLALVPGHVGDWAESGT
jgi:hypothetical protein